MRGDVLADLFLKERQALIRRRLAAEGRVMAGELAREFETSEDTIRRDLREMAAAGLCERVYGGAVRLGVSDRPLSQRSGEGQDRKMALARVAVELLPRGGTVFFDAGSTNLAIARALPADFEMTAITNAPLIAVELMERSGIDVIAIGGRIDPVVGGAIDSQAMREAEAFVPDVLVLGACGFDEKGGITATRHADAQFKHFMVERSRAVLVALTTEKIGVPAPFSVAGLSRCGDVVVEHDAGEETIALMTGAGARVTRAAQAA